MSWIGHTVISPLPFLHGHKWNDTALAYVQALRPSEVRVVKDFNNLDEKVWRVTVWLEKDGETIMRIDQEVHIGIPVNDEG